MALPPSSVWIDAQGTQSYGSAERGIGRHIVEITGAVHGVAPDLIGSVRFDPALPVPRQLDWLTGTGLLGWGNNRPREGVPRIFHVPAPFEPLKLDRIWPEWVRRSGGDVRTVVTLFDLIPLVMSEIYLDPYPAFKAAYTARLGLIRRAHHILAISDQTARDAVEHLGVSPDSITNIEEGVSQTFSTLVTSREEAAPILKQAFPELREDFLLYVGGGDARKNMRGTIEAFSLMSEPVRHAHQLMIVCKLGPHETAELRAYARRLGIADADLVFGGFVTDRELAALYRLCGLFVFPSLYEGFGLPILEAMSCGAPAAASNNSSIPEVLGDLEATFDPADPADIAATVEAVIENPPKLEALRERSRERVGHYSWERTAELCLEGYEKALALPVAPRIARERKRLMVVASWPPQPSETAVHSERLVDALAEHADVDVVVAAAEGSFSRALEPRVRFWPISALSWLRELRDHDAILYLLGGSPQDPEVLEALLERPGLVALHDVRLIRLYPALQKHRIDDPDWLREKLIDRYATPTGPPPVGRLGGVKDSGDYVEEGIFLTQELQEHADRVVVHSLYQADVLRRERPERAAPTSVVPAPIPDPPQSSNGTGPEGGPLVVSCGRLDVAGKRLGLVIEAFAALAADWPGARLKLLGDAGDGEREAVEAIAAKLGVGDSVEVRGRVDAPEYWSTLAAADLAVQLRDDPEAGAVSGSVCDAVAARVPTIVNGVGWFRELPEPVVSQVAADCSPSELASRMSGLLADGAPAAEARAAQDEYAAENSFAKLAERYAELLRL
jgi:glycosyltransferase involved in cell wall biosynthesis